MKTEKTENWHTRKMREFKTKSEDSLKFIIKDCWEAIEASSEFNEKCGQYADEIHYANAEIIKRREKVAA